MVVLGMDIGYSNLKVVVSARDGGSTAPRQLLYPVGAAPIAHLGTSIALTKDRSDGFEVLVDGEQYIAAVAPSRLQHWTRALHEDFPSHRSYRALFHAALLATGCEDIGLLVTGLPVDQALDRARVEALEHRLTGRHEVRAGRHVNVRRAKVVMQPVGGYLDLVRADASYAKKNLGVCVLDPGYFSVDWITVRDGQIRDRSSGTSHLATSVVLERAAAILSAHRGSRVSAERIEQTLRDGRTAIDLVAGEVDLGPALTQAAAATAPTVVDTLRQSLRAESEAVDVICLVGGGGSLYRSAVADAFPTSRVLVAKEPVFANARGFWVVGARSAG